ncbi:hypothetical protein FPQ18DRAFT_395180 [Pyronema domesticum]|uniref:Uncharacterized protein n=1 Tax=Pyronema omphalodes (strain CBS 100304) TaxID=1076935 RepID=U4KZH6_PYROM|nr:hypothetical protein FPQ18DRAFT_395180 [Pyronema domesticum]CCX07115.1 Protein of unknown function [Pyronema omphalodes CBS 100304]
MQLQTLLFALFSLLGVSLAANIDLTGDISEAPFIAYEAALQADPTIGGDPYRLYLNEQLGKPMTEEDKFNLQFWRERHPGQQPTLADRVPKESLLKPLVQVEEEDKPEECDVAGLTFTVDSTVQFAKTKLAKTSDYGLKLGLEGL